MSFKEMISSQDRLDEAFFGSVIETANVAIALKDFVKKENLPKEITPEKAESFKSYVSEGIKIIEKSKLDKDMKESLRVSFLGGVGEQLKVLTGKAPIFWNKIINFDRNLYSDMVKGMTK